MYQDTCCFTGHRDLPQAMQERTALHDRLVGTLEYLISQGVIYFGSGGALGFDTLAAETVLELRRIYPQIRLILVLPCQNQDRRWKPEDKARYAALKQQADKVIYTSEAYFNGCMQVRNRHLVEHSGHCVCYCTRTTGGTAYTLRLARASGLPCINLAETENI